VPQAYAPLVALTVALNLALVFVSTAVGGLLVETGQRFGATGRLSSLREALVGVIAVVGGPLGGWLAARAFGWTAAAGAAVLFLFLPVVVLLHREPRRARADRAVLAAARRQLDTIVRSRPMWASAALLFLVYLAPGFQTPLLYHQQDVLHFGPQLIGNLQALGGAGALAGAVAYAVLCRFVSLRTSLVAGILLNTASTLFYLAYDSAAAAVAITASAAFLGTLATLPLFDLAARATPRGSESLGYALLLAVYSLSQFGVSNVLGSYLYDHFHLGLARLVWVNAGSTAAVLLFVPLLPRALLARREGRGSAGPDL
jgi:predicted MFS family arabinose efflux permease